MRPHLPLIGLLRIPGLSNPTRLFNPMPVRVVIGSIRHPAKDSWRGMTVSLLPSLTRPAPLHFGSPPFGLPPILPTPRFAYPRFAHSPFCPGLISPWHHFARAPFQPGLRFISATILPEGDASRVSIRLPTRGLMTTMLQLKRLLLLSGYGVALPKIVIPCRRVVDKYIK